jgi:homeobox protein cut-like
MSDFQSKLKTGNPTKQESNSLVPILTSQRDRYKQRFEESHRNSMELSAKLSNLQDQLNRFQQDNVALYEKLKYQESYRGGLQQNSSIVNIDSSRRNDTISARYRDKYEESIDPFRHFKQVSGVFYQFINL